MPDRTCIEDGCERPGRGPRCTMHYQRFRAAGGVSPPRGSMATCTAPDCSRSLSKGGLGYCSLHYQRLKNWGDIGVGQAPRVYQPRAAECSIGECSSPVTARGWCEAHYCRWKTWGDPLYTKRAAFAAAYDLEDGVKQCTLCQKHKPAESFHRSQAARDGLQGRCIPCQAKRSAETRDPERARQWQQADYLANAEKYRADSQRWREANPERVRKTTRLWYEKNRDRRREYSWSRRAIRAEQCKGWRTPERSREYTNRRRARKLNAPQGDPILRREYVAIIMNDPCVYCGAPVEHLDHIQPLTSGGSDAWDNLAPACRSCNSRKHTRDLLTFLLVREQPSRREARRARKQAE